MGPRRNAFACLVHESQECVIDLVHNLRSLDPDSTVLLYDGGPDPRLLAHGFPFERYGAIVVPDPRPMRWGRLHDFALDCMRFLLASLPFDTMTIVDSDQLAIRPNYSGHLERSLAGRGTFGMLVNEPTASGPETDLGPLRAAYEERELWQPFLRRFTGDREANFRWSFWPATVFSADAARALVTLFDSDRELQDILARSRLWASEEVLFPTLVSLLGYELRQHPCRYDYTRYGARYSEAELESALSEPEVFWMHPVPRRYDDGLRRRIRERVVFGARQTTSPSRGPALREWTGPLDTIVDFAQRVPGWFEPDEARLLISACAHALTAIEPAAALVEVGSHCGRSTVMLASVVARSRPDATLYAIDPHEGVVGSLDDAMVSGPPTIERLRSTLASAGLGGLVRIIAARTADVRWSEPVMFLLLDGLHDYASVARDFLKFEPHLVPGGLVAFHDYSGHYAGVRAFVDEVLGTGRYALTDVRGSLVIVTRLRDAPAPAGNAAEARDARPAPGPATWSRRAPEPLVSCIMPTADRPEFLARAIEGFLRQDYEARELIIVDDGDEPVDHLVRVDPRIQYGRVRGRVSLGAKRNLACERAGGAFIVHWDDDDWYAPWRLSYQVRALCGTPHAVICGLSTALFFDPLAARAWRYTWFGGGAWVHGATFCYRRAFWERVGFPEISEGEDVSFVRAAPEEGVLSLEHDTFYVGIIHGRNASAKHTEGPGWSRSSEDAVRRVMGDDWPLYLGR